MLKLSIKNILLWLGVAAGIIFIALILIIIASSSFIVIKYGTPAEHGSSYR